MARRSRQLTTLNAPDRRFVVVNSDRAERPSAGHGPNIARLPATIARTERTVASRGGGSEYRARYRSGAASGIAG